MFVKSFGIHPMLISVVKDLAANGLIKFSYALSTFKAFNVLIQYFLYKQRSNLCFKWKTELNIGIRDMTRTSMRH